MTDVLHVLHTFPPESHGGIQRYVERIARAQMARGRTVVVACASGASEPSNENWNGIDVRRVPALDPFEQLAALDDRLSKAERWNALLDQLDPAVVHVHHWQGVPLDLLARARSERATTVATLHDFFTTCPMFFRLREERELCAPDLPVATCAACVSQAHGVERARLTDALPRRMTAFAQELARASAVLCASKAQADYWRAIPEMSAIEPTVLALPWTEGLEPVPAPAADGVLELATWGGLVRGKGLHIVLDALRELPREQLRVHHHGPHLDAAYLAELRAHPCADRLELHGPFDLPELARNARRYHLAVHPSLFLETHGLTTDEALALGLPVIVPDRGAPCERIGSRGTTFRVGDAHDLARVLRDVLADRGLLERWRQGARAPQPSLDEHLDELDRVYA